MEYNDLYDLITCLEYGTNIHISVVFLENYGNFKTELPKQSTIHSTPFCWFMKSTLRGDTLCFKCRNLALHKAITYKQSFGGLCINGIYEYCYPVVDNDNVIAVIFIGNILPSDKISFSKEITAYEYSFEKNFSQENCEKFAKIINNHIKLLISEYSNIKTEFNPLIVNIINYIEESLYYDISVKNIATAFNYNEKYIGKLFRKHTGKTIKEHLNDKRLKKSKELLKNSKLPIVEISSKVGFNNVTYFNRLFKNKFKQSPTEYRASFKG